MRNQITAAEAYLIATGEYENQMNRRIEENLNSIYTKVRNAIKGGKMEVNVGIDIIETKYQKKIFSILEEKGFKTRFCYDEIDGEHYVNVSWKHIGNEQ